MGVVAADAPLVVERRMGIGVAHLSGLPSMAGQTENPLGFHQILPLDTSRQRFYPSHPYLSRREEEIPYVLSDEARDKPIDQFAPYASIDVCPLTHTSGRMPRVTAEAPFRPKRLVHVSLIESRNHLGMAQQARDVLGIPNDLLDPGWKEEKNKQKKGNRDRLGRPLASRPQFSKISFLQFPLL